MAYSRTVREHLLSIVDRLHVEKLVLSAEKDHKKEEEAFFKDVVHPALLQDPRNTLFTVEPGSTTKVRRRVYMLRRSKTTEGGSLVCEVCGHSTFKLFPTPLETTEGGKRVSQWRKTEVETVQACRSCFIERNGGHTLPYKTNDKVQVQPLFDHHPCGLTTGRASDSWHFVRRDIVSHKAKLLLNHQCEDQSDILTDVTECETELTDDEETYYEDSDTEQYLIKLPFQISQNGEKLNFENEKPLILSPNLELPIICENIFPVSNTDMVNSQEKSEEGRVIYKENMQNEVNVEVSRKNDNSSKNELEEDEYVDVECGNEEILIEKLLNNIKNKIDIEIDESNSLSTFTDLLTQCVSGDPTTEDVFHCFNDRKCLVRKIRSQLKVAKSKKKSVVKSLPKLSYRGVCKLVTLVCPKKAHYVDNSSRACLYDVKGFPWRKQDLPSFVNLSVARSSGVKRKSYRNRKREIDHYLNVNHNDRINEVRSRRAQYQSERRDSLSSCEKTENVPSDLSLNVTGTSQESPDEKCRDEAEVSSNSMSPFKGLVTCAVCRCPVHKSYSVYDRENSPLRLLQYFEDDVKSIRICRTCLPYSKPPEDQRRRIHKKPTTENTCKKRARETDEDEDSDAPSKQMKLDKNRQKQNSPKQSLKTNQKSSKLSKASSASNNTTTSKDTKQKATPSHSFSKSPTSDHRYTTKNTPTPITPPSKGSKVKKSVSSNDNKADSPQRNLKVVPKLDGEQLKKITDSTQTKYVIVQATSSSDGSTIQKLSTVAANGGSGDGKCNDITINGKRYKIDTEFKLNELVKENENAGLSGHRDLLAQLPSILKRTIGHRNGAPTKYKIVNVLQTSKATNATTPMSAVGSGSYVAKNNAVRLKPTKTQQVKMKVPAFTDDPKVLFNVASKINATISSSSVMQVAPSHSMVLSNGTSVSFPMGAQRSTAGRVMITSPSFVKTAANINTSVTLSSITHQMQEHWKPKVAATVQSNNKPTISPLKTTVRPANTLIPKSPLNTASPLNTPLSSKSSGLVSQFQHELTASNINLKLVASKAAMSIPTTATTVKSSTTPSGMTKLQIVNSKVK